MFRTMNLFLVTALLLGAGSQAVAQDHPLSYFSGEVDVLIRLKEPDQTLEKVVKLVNQVQPGAGDALRESQLGALGALISNPTLTGVDQSRDWYAGVYFQAGAQPIVVFAIPAVKSEDLVSAVGEMTTRVHEKWVLYTDAESIPEADSAASAATKMGAARISSLTSGDLSIDVNVAHVREIYADQIEVAQDKVLESLNQLRFLPSQGGMNPQVLVEIYGTLAEGAFQALADGQVSQASLSITDTELVLNKQVIFSDNSPSAQFLANNKQAEMPELLQLPDGGQIYYGISGEMKTFMRAAMKLNMMLLQDGDQTKQLNEMTELMQPIHFGPLIASLTVSKTDPSPFHAITLFQASPIDAVRRMNREVVKKTETIETETLKQTSTLKPDAETYGEFKADLVEIKQEFKTDTPAGEMQMKFQKMMGGNDAMISRVLYLKDEYITCMGGGEKRVHELLKRLNSTKTNQLVKARKPLMKTANLLLFLDLARFFGDTLSVAATHIDEFPLPINSQMIDTLNLKPSYLSMAAGSDANTAQFEMRLPIEQILGITKLSILIGTSVRGGL